MKLILLSSLLVAGSTNIMQCRDAQLNYNLSHSKSAVADQYNDALLQAVEYNDILKVKMLLNAGGDVNAVNEYGATALSIAVRNQNLEIVQILLEADADVNKYIEYGRTVLMTAADNHDLKMVEMLIEAGADIHMCDSDGDPVFWYAFEKPSLFNFFITAGVDINARNNEGKTLLHALVSYEDIFLPCVDDIYDMFRQANASVFIKDNEGKSSLDTIFERGGLKLIKCIINSDTFDIHNDQSEIFFMNRIKDLITLVKGTYLSENTVCGYSHWNKSFEYNMDVITLMMNKGMYSYRGLHLISDEINHVNILTKGSAEEMALCAEYQVLPKTLSLYNYKKAMKIELENIKNKLLCIKNARSADEACKFWVLVTAVTFGVYYCSNY